MCVRRSEKDEPMCEEAAALYETCCSRAPALAEAALRVGWDAGAPALVAPEAPSQRRRTHRHTVRSDGGVAWQPKDSYVVREAGGEAGGGGFEDVEPVALEAGGGEDGAAGGGGGGPGGREGAVVSVPMLPMRAHARLDDLVDDIEGETEAPEEEAEPPPGEGEPALTEAQRVEAVSWRRQPGEPNTPGDQFHVTPAMARRAAEQKKRAARQAKKKKRAAGKGAR